LAVNHCRQEQTAAPLLRKKSEGRASPSVQKQYAVCLRLPYQRRAAKIRRKGSSYSNSHSVRNQCGLTPRSSGAPTAGRQARAAVQVCIFCSAGLASYRCRPLTSNVRPHKMQIRVLAPSDAPDFQALRLSGLQECPEAFASSYEEEVGAPLAEIQKRLQPRDDSAIFGAFQESGLCALSGVFTSPRSPEAMASAKNSCRMSWPTPPQRLGRGR
jgi:hypothetical protein